MRSARRIAELKADGLHCSRCLRLLASDHDPKFRKCAACRAKVRAKRVPKPRRPGKPQVQRQREYLERKATRGICDKCQRPRKAKKNGKVYRLCEEHLQAKRSKEAHRIPNVIAALTDMTSRRLANGLCRHCQKPTPINARGRHWTECEDCRLRLFPDREQFFRVVVSAGNL